LWKIKSIFSKKSINLKQRNDLKALIEKAKRSCKTLNKDISKQKQEIAEFEDKKELFEKHLKILNTQLETLKKVDNIFN
jgi:predicted ribosome quality control (RQC) complex YloA/Tae2 family protein